MRESTLTASRIESSAIRYPVDRSENANGPMQSLNSGSGPVTIRSNRRFFLWSVWIVWLLLLISPIVKLIQSHPDPVRLLVCLIGVTLYAGIYLSATWRNVHTLLVPTIRASVIPTTQWLTIALCMVLSVVIGVAGRGGEWLDPFVLTSAYVGSSLPFRRALPTLGALYVLILLAAWIGNISAADYTGGLLFVAVVGITTFGMSRSFIVSQELHAAREEIAHLAVMNERLRIARDLHDLLGHNLSLITLKSELARRLISVAPERAAIEIGDVEQVARTTLQEVREAVAQYRQSTLASELYGAQEILTAAGIGYRYEGDEQLIDALPNASESVLAWAVREGVTNVIRHSRAHQCTIRLARDQQTVSLEIIDDGIGVTPDVKDTASTDKSGNGLRGLTERVMALGGRCEAGFVTAGGYRLAIYLPLRQRQVGIPAVTSEPSLVNPNQADERNHQS